MSGLVLHSRTRVLVDNYKSRPSHALLLTGAAGSGKLHLAKSLADSSSLTHYVISVEKDKSLITIEQIRAIYSLTKTGTPVLIIIQDAELMSKEAQNAFLKLLEEPPKLVRFILTAQSKSQILATIVSRSQHIDVTPLSREDLLQSATPDNTLNITQQQSLAHLSQGKIGAFKTYLFDDTARLEILEAADDAKKFYKATPYERHLQCIEHNYDKQWYKNLLDTLALIVQSLMKTTDNHSQLKKLITQAELINVTAKHLLVISGNPKIHLAKLASEL